MTLAPRIRSRARFFMLGSLLSCLITPAFAQLRYPDAPPPDGPPGNVLGGAFCRDMATMLGVLEQRQAAFQQAAENLQDRTDAASVAARETAQWRGNKTQHEAAALREDYAFRCDPSVLPAAMAETRQAQPARPGGTPLGIEIPAQLAGTDGWVLTAGGAMARPWRDDVSGQLVRSEIWMYLSDEGGLLYAEPVVSEVLGGARYTMRMTCQEVSMASDTGFRFDATVRNFPERRYVAEGEIEVTGPMTVTDGAVSWPVRVRYEFSYQERSERGVRFADGGSFQGEGIARRLSDVQRRMQRSTQTLEHACNG